MADTTAADVEAVAKAIYDEPGPDGDAIAAYLSEDGAPRLSATTVEELRAEVMRLCRIIARAAIAADPARKRMEEALRALARPDGFVRSSIEEEKKARMAFARAALEGGEL